MFPLNTQRRLLGYVASGCSNFLKTVSWVSVDRQVYDDLLFKQNKTLTPTTCRMLSALISAQIPIQSSPEGACAPNCSSVWKCICDLRRQSGRTSVILTSSLAAALACVYQISPATDARHIVINPLICSVYTHRRSFGAAFRVLI